MSESGGEGRKRGRLSRSGDFDRAYRDGHSHANRHVVLYAFPRSEEEAGANQEGAEIRLGISVGRKVGGAVERNKVKRTMREAFWMLGDVLPPGHDFVLVGRPEISKLIDDQGIEGLRGSIAELLERARADQA